MLSGLFTSNSEGARHPRALAGLAAFAIALCTLVALEAAVRAEYDPPGQLMPRLAEAKRTLDPVNPDVLVFGSCLGQEALDLPAMAASLGPTVRVHSLTVAGTAPLDWYLALRNVLDPALVELVVVTFSVADLETATDFWQVQSLDLADAGSIREMAWWSCTEAECVSELYLRKASLLYRNWAYLANRAWTAWGTRTTNQPPPPTKHYPGRRVPVGRAPAYFVERFVQTARAASTPVVFAELPGNPDVGAELAASRRRQRDSAIELLGKLQVPVFTPTAPSGEYTDDVHVTVEGRGKLTAELAAHLGAVLAR